MRKLILFICIIFTSSLFGCQSNEDTYTFEQWIEYSDYVGIIRIDELVSVYYDETYLGHTIADFEYTEINVLMGSSSDKEKLQVVHSNEKEYNSYCVFDNNDNYYDCYDSTTEDYIVSDSYFIMIGYYDDNKEESLCLRFLEKLIDFDETKSIDEQNQSIQDIILRYTTVIDSLESTTNESTEATTTNTDT